MVTTPAMAALLAGRPGLSGGCRAVESGARGDGCGSAARQGGGPRGSRGIERGAFPLQFPAPGWRFSGRAAPSLPGHHGPAASPAPPRRSGIRAMRVGTRSRPSERPTEPYNSRWPAISPRLSFASSSGIC